MDCCTTPTSRIQRSSTTRPYSQRCRRKFPRDEHIYRQGRDSRFGGNPPNGVLDFAFSVDTDNSVIKLATPPSLAEEIEVSYMRESSQRRSGMLSAPSAAFERSPRNEAWAALGTTWWFQARATPRARHQPGPVTLTAG
jgi:hypothetical protein